MFFFFKTGNLGKNFLFHSKKKVFATVGTVGNYRKFNTLAKIEHCHVNIFRLGLYGTVWPGLTMYGKVTAASCFMAKHQNSP